MLASEFVFLEQKMADILSILLGTTTPEISGYVMRAIKSPKGRMDVMRDLLELAEHNKELPPSFDAAIDEFRSINGLRNDYIHGEWWTYTDGQTYVSIFDEHGFGLVAGKPVGKTELQAVRGRITAHLDFVRELARVFLWQKLRPKPTPQSPENG